MNNQVTFLSNFTVFDFETSGLNPRTDYIIEACVIRVRNGVPTSVYNSMVQLPEGVQLPPDVTKRTGHTAEDIASGISQESLAYILWEMFDMHLAFDHPELLIAYNALFDMSFLEALFIRHGLHHREDFYLPNPFIDPLTIARNRDPFPHKLEDSCRRHGIPLEDAHSAYNDTFALLDLVLDQHARQDISEWINVAGYRAKYGEPSWYPPHAKLIKQGAEVINHSKKPVTKPKVKPRTVVTKNSSRQKMVPDDPKEFNKKMPSGFLPKHVKDRIDAFMRDEDPFNDSIEVGVMVGEEFDSTMDYLLKVLHIPENRISSYLDTPEDAVIEVYKFPYGRIDISDDDLPF